MKLEDLLLELVAIPSLSGEEARAAQFVVDLASSWGYSVKRHQHNVWFELGSGSPRVLLASHLDTVKPCAGWTSEPWKPQWQDDRLAGLGANDAKGCVASMLDAARALASSPPANGTLVFAFTAEEETGGKTGMGELLPLLGPLDAAFVGEPTALQPCVAQRGMLLLTGVAKGESGHVAHASMGVNAIHKAARDIVRLEAMAFEPHELLGTTRAQVTLIHGGLTRNQVPDACEFSVDLRTTPNLDHDALAKQIAAELESEVCVYSSRYVPKATSPESPIARAARQVSGKNFIGSATTSDWAFLGSIPAVKIGPGDTLRSHRANEFITRQELSEGARFYREAALLTLALCCKEIPDGR